MVTTQNNRNEVVLLRHDVYFHSQYDSQICITTVARPQFAGSGEPATKANNTILLATFLFSRHEPIYFIENKEKTLRASYDRGTQIFDYMD